MKDIEQIQKQALFLHSQGRLTQAEQLCRQILGSAFPALHLLSLIRMQQGRSAEALELISAALKVNPLSIAALVNHGTVLSSGGRFREALESFNKAASLDSRCLEAITGCGHALQKLGRFDEAVEAYGHALAINPDHFEALYDRGHAFYALARHDEALTDYNRALAMRPDDVNLLNDHGVLLRNMEQLPQALRSYDRALALDPSRAVIWDNRANVLMGLGRNDEALTSFDRAIALEPGAANTYVNKAYCILAKGDLPEGFRLFEWRKKLPEFTGLRDYASPPWTGRENVAGKTVFVYADAAQGLGDTIQFYRYAILLQCRGARVILSAQQSLARLLRHAHDAIEIVGPDDVPPSFDYHAGLFSLPLAFGTQKNTIPAAIPYLVAEHDRVGRWGNRIGGQGFKVGVCWQGKIRPSMGLRSFPRSCFDAFCGLDKLRLVSLQKECQTDMPQRPGRVPIEMLGTDFDAGPDAFLDTAAAMENLDLVITPDTAIAHLAAALGRPVWIALKHVPDWRWCPEGATTAWYPTARLIRQATPGDWGGVFEDMRGELARLVRGGGLTEVAAATE